jgi:hypothetical protein
MLPLCGCLSLVIEGLYKGGIWSKSSLSKLNLLAYKICKHKELFLLKHISHHRKIRHQVYNLMRSIKIVCVCVCECEWIKIFKMVPFPHVCWNEILSVGGERNMYYIGKPQSWSTCTSGNYMPHQVFNYFCVIELSSERWILERKQTSLNV